MATDDKDPIAQFNLYQSLTTITDKLKSIDERVSNLESPRKGNVFMETFKAIVGGWPAFGLLFLVLFYTPLQKVMDALPKKFEGATEFTMAGISIKTKIQEVADIKGVTAIGKAIPKLSDSAIESLIKAPVREVGLYTYNPKNNMVVHFNFPSPDRIKTLEELLENELININGSLTMKGKPEPIKKGELANFISAIKKKYPGTSLNPLDEPIEAWELKEQFPMDDPKPFLGWGLSEKGKSAVDIILLVVGKSISSKSN